MKNGKAHLERNRERETERRETERRGLYIDCMSQHVEPSSPNILMDSVTTDSENKL